MMGGFGMNGGFGAGFGGVFMILWWALVIVGIVWAVRWMGASSSRGEGRDRGGNALDILKERYARGEIDEQEFQKRKHDLTH